MRGCLLKRSSDLTANFTLATAIGYDQEEYDTDALHNNVTNNTRITVPGGVAYMRLSLSVRVNNIDSTVRWVLSTIFKNDVAFTGRPFYIAAGFTDHHLGSLLSPPLQVVAGDYFTHLIQNSSDTSVTVVAADTWFGAEILDEASFSGAIVKKAADQTSANYLTETAVAWDSELYDVGGWHDNTTNNTRLTVPSGVSQVRLYGVINQSAIAVSEVQLISIRKNGTTRVAQEVTPGGTTGMTISLDTPILDVSPGDYFELMYQNQPVDNITTIGSAASIFAIEKVS